MLVLSNRHNFFVAMLIVACIITPCLVGLALVTNTQWLKSILQDRMSQALHRRVRLGTLGWRLGFHEMVIGAGKVSVVEPNGGTFLVAEHGEVGIALLSLIEGKLILSRVDCEKPEIYLSRLPNGHWNFDDLRQDGPDIRSIQVKDGQVHITDMADARSGSATVQKLDLQQLGGQFVFPWEPESAFLPFLQRTTEKLRDGSADYRALRQ